MPQPFPGVHRPSTISHSTFLIYCRTAAEIAKEQQVDMASLRDPQEDKDRVQGDPKW